MCGEGQELRVVQRPLVAVPQHHDLHVVVQAGPGRAAEMLEGPDVFAQGGRQILGLDEAQVLPPRVTQHVAEEVDAATPFAREVDVVGAVIHLGLRPPVASRSGPPAHASVAGRSSSTRSRTMVRPPGEAPVPQLLEDAHRW